MKTQRGIGDSWPKVVRSHPDDTFVWGMAGGSQSAEKRDFRGIFGFSGKNRQNTLSRPVVNESFRAEGFAHFFSRALCLLERGVIGWRRHTLPLCIRKAPCVVEPRERRAGPLSDLHAACPCALSGTDLGDGSMRVGESPRRREEPQASAEKDQAWSGHFLDSQSPDQTLSWRGLGDELLQYRPPLGACTVVVPLHATGAGPSPTGTTGRVLIRA